MTSATDELRRLLDERGVEWWYGFNEKSTIFDGEHDVRYEVDGILGLLFIRSALNVTPEQAIAATLGNDGVGGTNDGVAERTTTRNTMRTVYGNPRPVCEVCGYGIGDKRWSYCPKCGARIVEVDK